MSLHRSGTPKETGGRAAESAGSAENGWLTDGGRPRKLAQGLCFRTYRPLRHAVNPGFRRPSEYPVNVLPAEISWAARLSSLRSNGHRSLSTPCVLPEKIAR